MKKRILSFFCGLLTFLNVFNNSCYQYKEEEEKLIPGIINITNLENYNGKYVIVFDDNAVLSAREINCDKNGKSILFRAEKIINGEVTMNFYHYERRDDFKYYIRLYCYHDFELIHYTGEPITEYFYNSFKVFIVDTENIAFTDGFSLNNVIAIGYTRKGMYGIPKMIVGRDDFTDWFDL